MGNERNLEISKDLMTQIKDLAKEQGMTVSEYVNGLVEKTMEATALEYVEIKIRIPKPIADFVEKFCDFVGKDVSEFWDDQLRDTFEGVLNALSGDYLSAEGLIKRDGLEEALAGR